MFEEDCQHEFEENVCIKCNLVIEKFFDKKYDNIENVKDTVKYDIIDQLKGIPEEIIRSAKMNIIRKKNETGKKVRNDKKQTFIQVYEALILSGLVIPPEKIAKQLKLGKKEINECIKEISKTSLIPSLHDEVNKEISVVIYPPYCYIEDICNVIGIPEHKDVLVNLTKEILDKKDILYTTKSNYIACAIVKKYCIKKNIIVKNFSKKNEISDNALKKAIFDIEEFF